MNNIIPEAMWIPVDEMQLEDVAIEAVRETQNVLVVAGPGAGKTELLAQKACYLLQTNLCTNPRKILAISFKKDAAENLKERVNKRCGKELSHRFDSMTYDAFAKNLLDRFRTALPEEYRPEKEYILCEPQHIRTAFKEAGYKNKSNLNVRQLDRQLNIWLVGDNLPILEENKKMVKDAWKLLLKGIEGKQGACLSFQMISRLVEYIIRENVYLRRSLQTTYSHVFLDEFQDTTSIQYDLIKTCFKNSECNLTAVGDSKQRIMLWAGALNGIFSYFEEDFNAKQLMLLMNHRSAPKLVELQKLMYASLHERNIGIRCSDKWEQDDGEVKLHIFNNHLQEASIISDEIENRIKMGVALRDICILTKQTPEQYTEEIIANLKERGICARVETRYQDLLKEPITHIIIHTLYLMFSIRTPDSWEEVNKFLTSIYESNIQVDPHYLNNKQKLLVKMLKGYANDLDQCNEENLLQEIVWDILSFYDVSRIKCMYPTYSQGNYLEKVVEKIIHLLWEEYSEVENNWIKAIEGFQGHYSIPIMTIHKSKGLEYDSVYFVGLEDSAFWNFTNQKMEDRCAFFVALSRAKKNIHFTFSKKRPLAYSTNQSCSRINEFFELIKKSKIATINNYDEVQEVSV